MRFLAIALAFSSLSAFACPNLAGTYSVCRSTTGAAGGSTDVVVTQTVQNGVTIYSITSTDDEGQERTTEEMIADGKTRTMTENEMTATETYKCSGPKVIGNQTISYSGELIADVTQEIQKKGNTVEIDLYGSAFGENYQDTLICE